MRSERKHYLDNIRWFVQILVVLYHVFFVYNGIGMPGTAGQITQNQFIAGDAFQYVVYPWFMATLFIVAGISSRLYLNNHTDKEFIKSRTTKLLVPSTIGVLMFGWVQGYLNMSLSENAFQSMESAPALVRYLVMCVSGTGVLWFLQVLWVLSLVLVLVRKIEKDRLWKLGSKTNIILLILFALPVWGSAQILNTPVISVYRFGIYGLMFFLGYFVFSHDEVIGKIKKYVWIFAIPAAASVVLFTVRYFGQFYSTAPVYMTLLFCLSSYFMGVTVIALFAKYMDFENKFTSWISKKAWGIYVFHYIGISAVAVFIARSGMIPAWLTYIITVVAGFGAGLVLYAVISRIPFVRWAVLGISKRKVRQNVQG